MKNFNRNTTLAAFFVSSLILLSGPMPLLAASPSNVNLGSAGNFVILSKTGISTTGSTSITGDLGLSPAAATYITGFALTLPAASPFSTSALVTGKVYSPSYADPSSANLTTAVLDMQNAYTDAAGRAASVTELGAGNISGMTLSPGVYKWGTGVTIPTDVTLSGSASDVWIFQIAQTLTLSSGAKIILSGGAQASNIYWVVAGQTTIGTTAAFNGTILDQTAIVLNTGATLNGRALAQTAVTLDSNAVTQTSGASTQTVSTPSPTPTPITTTTPSSNPTSPVACTMEAMLCPDGHSVSRQGPSCSFASCSTTSTTSPSVTSDDAQKAALQIQISGLQSTLRSLQSGQSASSNFGQQIRNITMNLGNGSRHDNVNILQQFLISQNKGSASAALARVGATSYFGALTRAALVEFQSSVGISPALGNFGSITRAYLSSHY